jgi:uncharacterized protein (TIGR03437 family)
MSNRLLISCIAISSFLPLLTAQPFISYRNVLNAASYTAAGLPGGSIARGSIFSIFGTNLGPTSSPALSFPLGTTLAGVSIRVTGASAVDAIPLYVSPAQINAIMPSTAPLGAASIVVTFNGRAGNPAPVQIVNSSFGIFTANVTGYGPGIATNFVSQTNQPINSPVVAATPGQTITLWGTGLGPVPYSDTLQPTAGNLPTQTEVFVGGISATIAYQGRSPCCSGDDQIIFTVPTNAPTGCWVPIQVRTEGATLSNTATMAITKDGSPCTDPFNPYAQEILAGGNIGHINFNRTVASYTIVSPPATDITLDMATVEFVADSAGTFPFNPVLSLPPAGTCTVVQHAGDLTTQRLANPFLTRKLDAGSALTVTGFKGARTVSLPAAQWNQLGKNIPGGILTNTLVLEPGTLTFSASGGKDVAAFQGSITNPTAVTWTNRSQISTVTRSQPLTVTWSGASSGQIVQISGISTDLPANSSARFTCIAAAGSTSFTIPAMILQTLPASSLGVQGTLAVGAIGPTATFAASGLDFGIASVSSSQTKPVTYQ